MDLTASFLGAAGAKVDDLDGIDIFGHIKSEAADFDRTLYWRARRGERTWRAVRDGKLKYVYVKRTADESAEEWFFDLGKDPHEQSDLTRAQPDQVKRLTNLLEKWERSVR